MICLMHLFDKVKSPGCYCVASLLMQFLIFIFANLGLDFLLSYGNSVFSYCSAGSSG